MQLTCGWAPTWAVHASTLRTHMHTSSAALWAPHATGLLAALRGRLDRRCGRAARPLRRRRRRSWRRLLHRHYRLLQLRRWCRRCHPRPPPDKKDCAQTPRLLVELVVCRCSRAASHDALGRLVQRYSEPVAVPRLGTGVGTLSCRTIHVTLPSTCMRKAYKSASRASTAARRVSRRAARPKFGRLAENVRAGVGSDARRGGAAII